MGQLAGALAVGAAAQSSDKWGVGWVNARAGWQVVECAAGQLPKSTAGGRSLGR